MRIRLYLDEDAIDSEVVAGLRSSRINLLTAKDAGIIGRDDEDALAFAAVQASVLYSFNKDTFFVFTQAGHLPAAVMPASFWLSRNVILRVNRFEGFRILCRACPPKRCATASSSSAAGELAFMICWPPVVY